MAKSSDEKKVFEFLMWYTKEYACSIFDWQIVENSFTGPKVTFLQEKDSNGPKIRVTFDLHEVLSNYDRVQEWKEEQKKILI